MTISFGPIYTGLLGSVPETGTTDLAALAVRGPIGNAGRDAGTNKEALRVGFAHKPG